MCGMKQWIAPSGLIAGRGSFSTRAVWPGPCRGMVGRPVGARSFRRVRVHGDLLDCGETPSRCFP